MELTKDTILYIALFLVPGYTMNAAYSSLVPQRLLDQQTALLRFLCFSLLNYAIWFWLIHKLIDQKYWEEQPVLWVVWLFALVVASPYILGFIAGIVTSKAWLRKLMHFFGLNPVHAVPTAWDYVLSVGGWVIVTLKDGSVIYGLYSSGSFASTIPEERDIYLETIYDRHENGDWIMKERSRGVWIAKDEIQLIEFLSFEEEGNKNGETPIE